MPPMDHDVLVQVEYIAQRAKNSSPDDLGEEGAAMASPSGLRGSEAFYGGMPLLATS